MICIFAQIKDEQPYLKEWLDYHFNLGFDHIYLMEDFDSNPHDDIIKEYGDKITLYKLKDYAKKEQFITYPSQRWSFNWFLDNNFGDKSDIDWCLFNDVDEFLEFEPGYTLKLLVEQFNDYPAFLLEWKNYGANNLLSPIKGKTMSEMYKYDSNIIKRNATQSHKSFVNFKYPTKYWFANLHSFIKAINTNFSYVSPDYSKCWLNHYFTKSWTDWIYRLKRGNVSKGCRQFDDFFKYNKSLRKYKDQCLNKVQETKMDLSNTKLSKIKLHKQLDIKNIDYDIKLYGSKPYEGIFNSCLNFSINKNRFITAPAEEWKSMVSSISDLNYDKTHRIILTKSLQPIKNCDNIIKNLISKLQAEIIYFTISDNIDNLDKDPGVYWWKRKDKSFVTYGIIIPKIYFKKLDWLSKTITESNGNEICSGLLQRLNEKHFESVITLPIDSIPLECHPFPFDITSPIGIGGKIADSYKLELIKLKSQSNYNYEFIYNGIIR